MESFIVAPREEASTRDLNKIFETKEGGRRKDRDGKRRELVASVPWFCRAALYTPTMLNWENL